MDPRLVKQAMKKMGMKQDDIPATEVIIKTPDKLIIIKNPNVQKVTLGGEESFQIIGEYTEASNISEEDLQTVMDQTACSKEEARKALENAEGDLAQAILHLQSK